MFKTILLAAAATCSLAASPSFAAPVAAAIIPVEGAAVTTDTAPVKTTARTHETRYCAVGMITGSIIEHKVCHTRKEWIDLTGTDPAKQN